MAQENDGFCSRKVWKKKHPECSRHTLLGLNICMAQFLMSHCSIYITAVGSMIIMVEQNRIIKTQQAKHRLKQKDHARNRTFQCFLNLITSHFLRSRYPLLRIHPLLILFEPWLLVLVNLSPLQFDCKPQGP